MSETTWRVQTVTMKPGVILAELHRGEWFKANPAYDEAAGQVGAEVLDEFIDANPDAVHEVQVLAEPRALLPEGSEHG